MKDGWIYPPDLLKKKKNSMLILVGSYIFMSCNLEQKNCNEQFW